MVFRLFLAAKLRIGHERSLAVPAFFILLFGFPFHSAGATLSLTNEGPATAREGDLIEYSLEVVNEAATTIAGIEVLDILPAEVQFVQATPTPGGTYDSITGVWTLPTLGIDIDNNTAGLQIEALVNSDLIDSPNDVLDVTNRAELIAPLSQTPLEAQVSTNVVCAFCIDWEIESVKFDWDPDDYYFYDETVEANFYLQVKVINNGPVASDATVSVTKFEIDDGDFRSVTLFPAGPVAVSLNPGQTRTIKFKSDREEVDDSGFTASWEVEISDVALLDPILPNTSSGSSSDEISDSRYDGCFVIAVARGSYLDRDVKTLRHFRDRHLATNPFGQWLVELYYRHSPSIADYIRERETLRTIVRLFLTVVVFSIEYPVAAGLILLLPPLVVASRGKQRKNRSG